MPLLIFSVASNARALERTLDDVSRKQIPFAASQATNRLARQGISDLKTKMSEVFDRPTPYTLNAFAWRKSNKRSMTAEIFARDFAGKGTPGWKFLTPEAFGGERNMKRFERALQSIGGGQYAVPGRGAKLNQFGNISQGDIVKMLSALGAAEQKSGYLANRTPRSAARKGKKLETYFIATSHKDGEPLGIYKVVGPGKVEPVIIFPRRAPTYRVRLPYEETVQSTLTKNTDTFMREELSKAIATAK